MLHGERAGGRKTCLQFGETVDDDRERRHQLSALFVHVAMEQRLHLWRNLEKAAVEQRRRLFGDRSDFREALLNETDLCGCHGCCLSPIWGRWRDSRATDAAVESVIQGMCQPAGAAVAA
jgi:hypothetical protein